MTDGFDDATQRMMSTIAANWDERTPIHPLLVSLSLVPGSPEDRELVLRNDYLSGRGAHEIDATYTYTDGPPLSEATTSYEWAHELGEVG